VSVLRRSHDHHRDIPARRLAAHPAGGIPKRDQGRYVMIRLAARQHPSASLPLRRLSTGNDHARRRTALNIRLVDQSPLRAAASAYRDRPTELATPLDRFPCSSGFRGHRSKLIIFEKIK
jgi:hypothetical protein